MPRRIAHALFGLFLLAGSYALALWPGIELLRALLDPNLAGPAPAAQSWRWHRALTPAFADWAQARIASGAATRLSTGNISGTEWPLFGSLFYLRATENLERAWLQQPQGPRPTFYARAAIDAAARLLADPGHASWVREHWGAERYLSHQNVFYRMLLIDGLATHLRLTGVVDHRELLRAQVDSLADELAASPTGLLADYPQQIFPADIAAAWHAIARADAVLGSDHGEEIAAGLRGLTGDMAVQPGLPPYAWWGEPPQPSDVRGCANAWLLHHAPFLWPAQARRWVDLNQRHFWQQGRWLAGYREFGHGSTDSDDFYQDVDSGPVIAGLGTSASAFGLGAARSSGLHGHARVIALQVVAASWPLPNGRLLAPWLLSDLSDAPLLGEAALVYNLSQPRAPGMAADATMLPVPGIVWVMLVGTWGFGMLGAWLGARQLRRALLRG